jgi:hypothetical protein
MLKNHLYTILIFFLFISFACVKKKVAKYGCKDMEATNFDPAADVDNGGCVYKSLITDPSFETDDWSYYTGTGYSYNVGPTSIGDGFMPTHGKYYLKCVPYINKPNGTLARQYLEVNKHCKGFYFDYSYVGVADIDSLLDGGIFIVLSISSFGQGITSKTLFSRNITKSPITYGNSSIVSFGKKDEYVELPLTDATSELRISTLVSKGTFTFCIDNIREVQR